MHVKFILAAGNTVSIVAGYQDRKTKQFVETDNVKDAIKRFHDIIGKDVPFVLASEVASVKAQEAQRSVVATHVAEDTLEAAGGASEGLVEAIPEAIAPESIETVHIEREVERHKLVAVLVEA